MACKSCKNKRRRKRKGAIAGLKLPVVGNIDVERAAGMAAGGVAAKLINGPAKKYLGQYLDKDGNEGRIARGLYSAGKIGLGFYMNNQKSNIVSDMGLGMIAVSGMELVNVLFPDFSISGLLDDAEYVGAVREIDLSKISGNRLDNRLESYEDVAGVTDSYMVEEMELAGAYGDVY